MSYIVHCAMNEKENSSLIDCLNDMFMFAERNKISNPFYCNRNGSEIHPKCFDLFFMIFMGKVSVSKQRNKWYPAPLPGQFSGLNKSPDVNLRSSFESHLSQASTESQREESEHEDDQDYDKEIQNLITKLIQKVNDNPTETFLDIKINNKNFEMSWNNSLSSPLRKVSYPPNKKRNRRRSNNSPNVEISPPCQIPSAEANINNSLAGTPSSLVPVTPPTNRRSRSRTTSNNSRSRSAENFIDGTYAYQFFHLI